MTDSMLCSSTTELAVAIQKLGGFAMEMLEAIERCLP